MPNDAEIEAMTAMMQVLDPLAEDVRIRVLGWALSRFAKSIAPVNDAPVPSPRLGVEAKDGFPTFETFAELMDAADPATDRARALVAAYWAQICEGQPSFAAQALNTNLKDLGHRLANITVSLEGLKSERPSLILQLKKDGTSRQARKTYKLTVEGARRVRAMIAKEEI